MLNSSFLNAIDREATKVPPNPSSAFECNQHYKAYRTWGTVQPWIKKQTHVSHALFCARCNHAHGCKRTLIFSLLKCLLLPRDL